MDRQLAEWKLEIERLWSARAPDYGEAVRIAAHIVSAAHDGLLRQAAVQALPILRSAADDDADQATRIAARRRVGVMREELLALVNPRFGKRESQPKQLSSEERHRQMLGLPIDGCLSAPEIHQAWKRAAKAAHPDAGGSADQFQALSAARDALIREVRLVRSV
jgi:hypothetical protein